MSAGRLSQYPFVPIHRANYASGRQGYRDLWFVLHCTDDEYSDRYAANLGNYWRRNPVKVSVHFCVTDYQTYQYVDMNDTAFQARNPGNLRGVGVELSGLKRWTRRDWLAHRLMIRRAAVLCAEVAAARGYKVLSSTDKLSKGQLRARASGVTQHADLTDTFGGSHQDLGDGFPWDVFWQELNKAFLPLAQQAATTRASQQAAEEEEAGVMAGVSREEFDTLARRVEEIHQVLIGGNGKWGKSNLRTQLGYIVGKIAGVSTSLDTFVGYEKASDAERAEAPPTAPIDHPV